MTEAEFQRWVVDQAKAAGWTVNHTYRARTGKGGAWRTTATSVGFPDLTLLRASTGQLVFLELKAPGGRSTPEQRAWVAGLQQVEGVEAYIVSPADAHEVLALLARPRPNPAYPIPATVPPTDTDQGAPTP